MYHRWTLGKVKPRFSICMERRLLSDVTAGDGEKGKASAWIERCTGLLECLSSTGSSGSARANVSGKDSNIPINVCWEGRELWHAAGQRQQHRQEGWGNAVASSDTRLPPNSAPQFITWTSFIPCVKQTLSKTHTEVL